MSYGSPTALYKVKMKLTNGAEWTEEIWSYYIDKAEANACAAAEAYGYRVEKILKTEVIARSK